MAKRMSTTKVIYGNNFKSEVMFVMCQIFRDK